MAYEQEALSVALDSFIRDVSDRLELSDEQIMRFEDRKDEVLGELLYCQRQGDVNEKITDMFGQAFGYDSEAMTVMAGTIDFFWSVYNDVSESEI